MKHYLLFCLTLSILISGCSFKTVRQESDESPYTNSSNSTSEKGAFSEYGQQRELAGNLEEKTAMQLRLNTKAAAPAQSGDTSLAGAQITIPASDEKIEQVNLKTQEQNAENQTAKTFSNSEKPQASSVKNANVKNSTTGWPKHELFNPVNAYTAMGWLKNGNTRYVKGKLRSDGMWQKDRSRTMISEKPHTIILSCSDSRIPPEVVFDQKLGEVYVVRTAAQTLDTAAIASIEYAISQLEVKLLVVMGHNSCSSIKAAANHMNAPMEMGSPAMNDLMAEIKPRLEEFSRMPATEHSHEWANVHGAAKDLIRKSQIVREAIQNGQLKMAPALYDLQSGRVDWK